MLNETDASALSLPAPLRPYQWEGVTFLFRSDAALLADEMGLGKTVQAAVALTLRMKGPDIESRPDRRPILRDLKLGSVN